MLLLALSWVLFATICCLLTQGKKRASGSEGSEEEEICMHQHERTAGPASKQEAGEQHKQQACDMTLCSTCPYTTTSVHSKLCFS